MWSSLKRKSGWLIAVVTFVVWTVVYIDLRTEFDEEMANIARQEWLRECATRREIAACLADFILLFD